MKIICFLISALFIQIHAIAQVKVSNLLCENKVNPVGIAVMQPHLSWQLASKRRNVMQTAYEIRVNADALRGNTLNLVWNTGKVSSSRSVHVPYAGIILQQGVKYSWQVRVWDNSNKVSDWSPVAHWRVGLLSPADWKAKWIEAGYQEDTLLRPAALFRKQFTAGKKIKSAVAYITSYGNYEAFINGKRVGDLYLTPGWTSFKKRLQYQMYDVTGLMAQGNNTIGAMLSNGWYRGIIGSKKNRFGKNISLLLQLNINYEDGTSETVSSDETWKSSTGSVTYSEIYNGETQDARREQTGWATSNFNDTGWSGVQINTHSTANIVATENEPVRKQEIVKPFKIMTSPEGDKIIDFGQNLVGWVIVKAKGKAGDTIRLSHAEVLDKDGNFYTKNLRAAKQQNTYILKGGADETFEPHFTWQGFRYVKVEGVSGEIKPENFTAVVIYSDMERTGNFTCSNPLINQLQHNIEWGQKGNFVDIPTDCPQRDERLGWTGDAQVFARTSTFNMNVNSFFAKWLKDLAADQFSDGGVPLWIPNIMFDRESGIAGWADAATIIPWTVYRAYGDKKILEGQYPSMKAWVGYIERKSVDNLWNTSWQIGDWLFYRGDEDVWGVPAVTDRHLIAQCFYANSVQLLINAAEILDKKEDVRKYSSLLKEIKAAFLKEYLTPNQRLVSGTQTAYTLALNFDMLPENMRMGAAKRLADNIAAHNNHLTTGFLGTPYLCNVLSRFGYDSVAYKLILQETYPSWLFPVKMGATTIWERWDGIKRDSTFQDPSMNSFNHYAYGAIGDWMYRDMAGLSEEEPGYKKIRIMPHIGKGITHAKADLQTYYGKASSGWQLKNNQLVLNVEVPVNTTATIFIPAKNADAITESGKRLSGSKDLTVAGKEGEYIKVEAGSGKYVFKVN